MEPDSLSFLTIITKLETRSAFCIQHSANYPAAGKCFDHLLNSFNKSFQEMYEHQS